jgi:hypothetical protein
VRTNATTHRKTARDHRTHQQCGHARTRRTASYGAHICEQFGEKYWQQCDFNREYPEQLVDTLTKAGYLSALIPGGCGDDGAQRANVDALSGVDR